MAYFFSYCCELWIKFYVFYDEIKPEEEFQILNNNSYRILILYIFCCLPLNIHYLFNSFVASPIFLFAMISMEKRKQNIL